MQRAVSENILTNPCCYDTMTAILKGMELETMTPVMPTIIDTVFKDDSPSNTVKRIKEMLKTYGIETEEKWNESGVPNCHSLRVSVFGTAFGVNGKGVTEEFALASGYGELMERLQLGRIFSAEQQKENAYEALRADDTSLPMKELLAKNRKWYTSYAELLKQQTGVVLSEEELLSQYCSADGNIKVVPFYCVNSDSVEHLPSELLDAVYSTNGCAAGNSMEEAVVQAISETVERSYSARILLEEISVPDIPEEVLQECPIAYKIISFLRENGFKVTVKDCSLGTKFPVVCVCLIDQKTGKYHTHFGAYPHFEIALQRTLTETFQGRNINEVAKFDNFFQMKKGDLDVSNLLSQLVKGTSERKPEFFMASSATYQKNCGFAGKNNQELLEECIRFFDEQGYDILIRDYSCLGFPTYQVIIPGFSEAFTYRLNQKKTQSQYAQFGQSVLRNPSAASVEEIMGFMMNLNQLAKRKMIQPRFTRQTNLPLQLTAREEQYLTHASMANLYYTLGRYGETIRYIDKMLATGIDKDAEKLICIKRYLMLGAEGYGQNDVRMILEQFHLPQTVQQLYAAVSAGKNLMDPFVAHCDLQCQASCNLYGICMKKRTEELVHFINTKQQEMDHSAVGKKMSQLLRKSK